MIQIQEITPIKLSGTSSLMLVFPYRPDIVEVIKQSGNCIYHKKEKVWEAPITSLSFLLDNLTYLDDIELKLLPPKKQASERLKTTLNYKSKPFPYQVEGIEYGLNHDKWLLLDAPGLGKSLQIIYLAEELKAQKGLEHCLILCGINSLKANWKKEIAKHSNLDYVVIGEKVNSKGNISYATIPERAAQLKKKIDQFFIIVNIETIRYDEVIDAIGKSENKIEMIAFDECHKCKDSQTLQGKNLLKLKDYHYKIAMTGTLIMNNPLDSFVPLKWLGIEHATLTNFKQQYCEFGGFGGHQVIGFKNMDILKEEIESNSLRRTKDLLDLPPKTVIDELVEMSPEHSKFYQDVRNLVKEECDKIELKTNNLLALTTRLRQATSCPNVLTTNPIISSKVLRCVELVEEIVDNGDKVVIMSNYKEPVYQLQELLKKYKPLIGTGDLKDSEVSNNIDLFQNDNEHKVFICTYSKCSTGITLNRARYMICLDECFTYAQNVQAQDRIHRVNNTQSVFIYNLICEGTIDERVHKISQLKKDISDYIVDDKPMTELLMDLIKEEIA